LNAIDYGKDFFGKPAFLLDNGMIYLEAMCCSIGNVYSYGPRFSTAKKQDKETSLAEFWVILIY
jgi:asparaginyl-tRNA synthetase